MRRTRNRKHRGGLFGFGEGAKNAMPAAPVAAVDAVPVAAPNEEKKPGFFNSLPFFGKNKKEEAVAPAVPNQPMPAAPSAAQAQGGKRKNRRCGMWGGSHMMGAPVNFDQVQATGGQPSEKIMQWATTAGGRRSRRHRKNKSNRKNKSRRNKSHRKNKSRKNKSRRNKSRKN